MIRREAAQACHFAIETIRNRTRGEQERCKPEPKPVKTSEIESDSRTEGEGEPDERDRFRGQPRRAEGSKAGREPARGPPTEAQIRANDGRFKHGDCF